MFNKLKLCILNSVIWKVSRDDVKLSYSRAGLDTVLREIFKGRNNGYYVDIGCYRPVYDSNTFGFYQRGWNGLAIDANGEFAKQFKSVRGRDVFLNCIATKDSGIFDYYSFKEPGYDQMNTISEEFKNQAMHKFNLKEPIVTKLQGFTLEHLLNENKPKERNFDLLCIDAEGAELDILQSNNWEKYSAEVILIELNTTLNDISSDTTINYLLKKGYVLISYVVLDTDKGNAFLIRKDSALLQAKRF